MAFKFNFNSDSISCGDSSKNGLSFNWPALLTTIAKLEETSKSDVSGE